MQLRHTIAWICASLLFVTNFTCHGEIQPPTFSQVLEANPTPQNILFAVETLSARNHEPEYENLQRVVRKLLLTPEHTADTVKALHAFPIRTMLPELCELLPNSWLHPEPLDFQVVHALAILGGPTATGILRTCVEVAKLEAADPTTISRLLNAVTDCDTAAGLELTLTTSRLLFGAKCDPDYIDAVQYAVGESISNGASRGPFILLAHRVASARLTGQPGSMILHSNDDAATAKALTLMANGLSALASAPALSVLALFALSDDPTIRAGVEQQDFERLYAAPWLALDPPLLLQLLNNPEPRLAQIFKVGQYPSPDVFPFASEVQNELYVRCLGLSQASDTTDSFSMNDALTLQSSAIDEVTRYVLDGIATDLKVEALTKAKLPRPLTMEGGLQAAERRLTNTVSFGLGQFNLLPHEEHDTAGFLVRSQLQRLGISLLSLIRAESVGVNVGAHGSLATIDNQLDTLIDTPTRYTVPRTQLVSDLPLHSDTLAHSLTGPIFINVVGRSINVADGKYQENITFTQVPDAVIDNWDGAVPSHLLPIVARHPRLLDFLGVSLAEREWRLASNTTRPSPDIPSLTMNFPEQVLPLLALYWRSGDIAWSDIQDAILVTTHSITGNYPGLPSMATSSSTLPQSLGALLGDLPASGVISEQSLEGTIDKLDSKIMNLLRAKANSRVLRTARKIIDDEMPNTVSIPTYAPRNPDGSGGGSGVQISSNHAKFALLNKYDSDIRHADAFAKSWEGFDLGTIPGASIRKVSLVLAYVTPKVDRFLGVYHVIDVAGDRLTFAVVETKEVPSWLKVGLLANPSLLPWYSIDLAAANAGSTDRAAVALTAAARHLELLELQKRDGVYFPQQHLPESVAETVLSKTEHGQRLLKQVLWNNSLNSGKNIILPAVDETASTQFSSDVFERWSATVNEMNNAVAREEARVTAEVKKRFDTGFTIGISLTLDGALPIYAISYMSGAWSAIVTTDFSTVVKILPAWNGIGLPIPISLGKDDAPRNRDAPPPAPPVEELEPVSDRQTRSSTYTSYRAGSQLLDGPACVMDISSEGPSYSSAAEAYINSLINDTPGWSRTDTAFVLSQFMRCKRAIDDKTPCNEFVYNVVTSVFGIDDFPRGMLANDMAVYLANSPGTWHKLGNGTSAAALAQAQAEANAGSAVIAVWQNPAGAGSAGHVALITPGVLRQSRSWGMGVPTAAQTSLNNIGSAWIGRPLSEGFGKSKQPDVWIYVRR